MNPSGDDWEELSEEEIEEIEQREDARSLSSAGIEHQNEDLLDRYRTFRRAADAIANRWRRRPEVLAIRLIGSLAVAPWKAVPRFQPYRRKRIRLWHECKDLDLAIWLPDLNGLNELRRAKNKVLKDMYEAEGGDGVASHNVDTFILEPGTDRYLGRLCEFNKCPKGKRECQVAGCGDTLFLRQHEDFKWRENTIADDRSMVLFDRATGQTGRAVDAPMPAAGIKD